VPLFISRLGRLYRVGLFHRLEGSSNLNSRDENNGTESLPDRFGWTAATFATTGAPKSLQPVLDFVANRALTKRQKPGPESLALASLRVGLQEEQGGKGRRKYVRSEPARSDGSG
jgi:hypothetical protein